MEHGEPLSSPSFTQKLKSSLTPSCFPVHYKNHHQNHHHQNHHQSDSGATVTSPDAKNKLIRMSSSFISRMGGGGGSSSRHSRRHSLDLHYDASSYALNFEDDDHHKHLDEQHSKSFSSRLPQSPKREIKAQ